MSKNKKKGKNVWQKYAATAFVMLLGAVCGILMVESMESLDQAQSAGEGILSLAVLFFGIYAGMIFHLVLHEAGHLLFGLVTGYRFSSFRIFSFMWLSENGKVRLKRLSLAGTGGQCLMAPPDRKEGGFPLVLYNLGGSVVNALAGGVFLMMHFLFQDSPYLKTIFLLFAVTGFMLALMNGIPMRLGMVDNDGYNAFSLRKNPKAAEAFWIQLKVNELISKGVRLKDMPREWFDVPFDENMKNSMIAARGVLACNRLMDEEKFSEAEKQISGFLAMDTKMTGVHRSLLILDHMYLCLIGDKGKETASGMMTKELKKFMKAMKTFPSVKRCEYALALLYDHDANRAEKIGREFEKFAKSYPYPVEIASERELMAIAERKFRQNSGAAA